MFVFKWGLYLLLTILISDDRDTMYELFLRVVSVALLVIYLTQSPDRLTKDEPAPWTEDLLDVWRAGARNHSNDWWQIQFLYEYFVYMKIVSEEEYKRLKGFVWFYVYRRACGRPVPEYEDQYFGTREFHPPTVPEK